MDTIVTTLKSVFDWVYAHQDQIKLALTIIGFILTPVVVYVKGFLKPVLKALGTVGESHGDKLANFIYKVFKVEPPKDDKEETPKSDGDSGEDGT
jgi:hypothetical protein